MKEGSDQYPHELFIQNSMIKWLREHGWSKKMIITKGSGPDIYVTNRKFSRTFTVECKGGSYPTAKYPDASAYVNFRLAIGQVITRKESASATKLSAADGGNKLGVAFPNMDTFKKHVAKLNWQYSKSLNLYLFFVNEDGSIEKYNWRRIKKEFGNKDKANTSNYHK